MNDTISTEDLAAINGSIERLQKSAKRTMPLFLIGIIATLVAAIVALYFIFTLSSDLKDAQKALRTSEERLAAAQQSLTIANEALRRVQREGAGGGANVNIAAAISDVARSQQDLNTVSASVREAASKLPTTGEAGKAVIPPSSWFAVIGSFNMDEAGLANAAARAERAKSAGLCAEIWQTQISKNYAVVIGTKTDRETARAAAARARSSKLAEDAFAQPDRGWQRIAQSPSC